jgi:CRP/FNR family transcriptional regulator, cyclic AMP receptor protein
MSVTINLFKHSDKFEVFAPGQIIFRQGQSGGTMYVIKAGEVEIQANGKTVACLYEGEILGEMSLLTHTDRSATAIARQETQLVAVDQQQFDFLVDNTPYFAHQMMQIMTYRLRQLIEQL